ncbi:MAG: 50S ribosomal protein L10 [Candidatus Muiribacteriota bacterium]
MPTPEKVKEVKSIGEKLQKSVNVMITDYKGLNVEEVTDLRKKFRENNVEYFVAKNTLLKKAINSVEFPEVDEFLKGPTAVAISYDDPVAPVKVATEFIKDLPKPRKFLKIKTSVMEGRVLTEEEIKTLAEIPSREELVTRFIRALNSPVQGFVNVLAGPLKNFVNVLNSIKNEKEDN